MKFDTSVAFSGRSVGLRTRSPTSVHVFSRIGSEILVGPMMVGSCDWAHAIPGKNASTSSTHTPLNTPAIPATPRR